MTDLALSSDLVQQLVTAVLGELKTNPLCSCHIIDCQKTHILAWKHKTLPNALTLRIADQRFMGLARVDKNGESYWKFKNCEEEKAPAQELNLVEKFQARQAQVKDHEPNNQHSS